MPLEPTANPDPNHTRRLSRRRLLGLATVSLAGTMLASCAQGTQQESEAGQRRDAQRTSVVDALQATESVGILHGTPPAEP